MITFLTMYWPKRLRPKGVAENTRSGKYKNGKKVRIIWIKASFKANFWKIFPINSNPIMVSQIASRSTDSSGDRNPCVNRSIVAFARSSAGLTPAKNFSSPNHRYTIPIVTEIKFIFLSLLIKRVSSSFIFFKKAKLSIPIQLESDKCHFSLILFHLLCSFCRYPGFCHLMH